MRKEDMEEERKGIIIWDINLYQYYQDISIYIIWIPIYLEINILFYATGWLDNCINK